MLTPFSGVLQIFSPKRFLDWERKKSALPPEEEKEIPPLGGFMLEASGDPIFLS